MLLDNQGSVVIFMPEYDFEYTWMKDNLDTESWQWQGKDLVVDHRPAQDVIDILQSEGISINWR